MLSKVDFFIVQNMHDLLIPQTTERKNSSGSPQFESKIIDVSTKDFFFSECSSLKDLCSSLSSVSALANKFYDVDNKLISEKLEKAHDNILDGSSSSLNSPFSSNTIKNTHKG